MRCWFESFRTGHFSSVPAGHCVSAVLSSASHPRCPPTKLHCAAVDQLHRRDSSFCTISLLLLLLFLLSVSLLSSLFLFSAFLHALATLSLSDVHLPTDGLRLRRNVEIILTSRHVSVLAGLCRVAWRAPSHPHLIPPQHTRHQRGSVVAGNVESGCCHHQGHFSRSECWKLF